jgi:hypothetical protein
MNKKIFASAILAVTALISSSAFAAITLKSSVGNTTDGYSQNANAVIAAGGDSVRANDIVVSMSADGDLPIKTTGVNGTLVVRLPKGINFDGAPTFGIRSLTPSVGLTLKDSAGDPTLTDPAVTMSDANGDGGMDRAEISIARTNVALQTLTISINITADSTVTKGTKNATVTSEGSVFTSTIVDVLTGFQEPLFTSSLALVSNIDQSNQLTTPTITSRYAIVTIPKGTASGTKLTFTPDTGVHFLAGGGEGSDPNFDGTSTITATILSPTAAGAYPSGPLSGSLTINANTLGTKTVSISYVVTGTATATLPEDMQVKLTISQVALKATTTTGERGLKLSGAVTGSWPLVKVAANGSAAAVKGSLTKIVSGGAAVQTLPPITITENFAGDTIGAPGTATITLTPSKGLSFNLGASATVSAGFWNATPTISATTGALSFTLNSSGASKTLTITGLRATATKGTAAGTATITVTGSRASAPKSDVLEVANIVDLGTVSVGLAATYKTKMTGPAGPANTTGIVLKETTYGAISRSNATASTPAYISFTPSSNATISAVSFSFAGYAAGATPTIGITTACAVDSVGSAVWICPVEGESSAVVAGTSTVTANITWSATAKAAIGTDVLITVGGNSAVSGEIKAGTVGQTTKAEVSGAIPDVKPGSLTASTLATVKITELFTGAVSATAGTKFRLLAPAGVSFQDGTGMATLSSSASAADISSTFRPNDTVTYTKTVATATVTVVAKAIVASGTSGLLAFELVDGDVDGKKLSNIAPATLDLAYADGTLDKLDAGKAAAVNVGFSVSNTVEGGLAPYTVASSAKTTATAEISGSTVTAKGVAAGAATITVTDALGATSTYVVTVSAGAAEPEQGKGTKASDGSESAATFTGGATTDGGTTYTDAITTADEVIINATINVDPEDVGEEGGIHALVLSPAGFLMLESDGSWVPWDGKISSVATYLEAEELAATYSVPLYNGTIATAGKWRFAVIYSTADGKLVYTTKAAVITVSE